MIPTHQGKRNEPCMLHVWGKGKKTYTILIRKSEGKRPIGRPGRR